MEMQADERRFDQFSPKRMVLLLHRATDYLKSKWLVITLSGLVLGLIFVTYSYPVRPLYTAEFSFALDDGAAKNPGNGLTRLSEELGFSPTYEAGGVFSSMTNIMELMQSRLLIEKTLHRSITLYKKPIIFANFFLDSLRYREKWMKDSRYKNIDFTDTLITGDEELFRNRILKDIYSIISTKLIKIEQKGKGTSLVSVSISSENELFSKYFLEALIDEVSRYYITLKTQRSKLQVDFIEKRMDSIRTAYMSSLYGRANFSDANLNPNLQINIVPGEKKQTDVLVLRETYMGLVRSLESARTALQQETPLFQYLDQPILPLKMKAGSLIFKFIVAFIGGLVLSSIFLLTRKFYRFLMTTE